MEDISKGTGAGLEQFLNWAGERGEINVVTAKAYKSAVSQVLGVEADPEHVDVRSLDVESLLSRFETLNRLRYSADSLKTYRSRFRNAVSMYGAWLDQDPNWKNAGKAVPTAQRTPTNSRSKRIARKSTDQLTSTSRDQSTQDQATVQIPVMSTRLVAYDLPLRPDLLVRINLPIDLTMTDADRIATFVKSLAFHAPSDAKMPSRAIPQEDDEEI